MTTQFPDTETVRAALSLAQRAPSIHNSQPWRWRVGEHSLHLYADQSMHLTHTDPDARDLLISCGIALNHCAIALAALGWQPTIHRLPDPTDRGHLASIETRRQPPSGVDIALAAAIPRRRTDRRIYSAWPVALGDIALMGARAARTGVTMRRFEASPQFATALRRAVNAHATDPDYHDELARWTGRSAADAGVPARNTPLPDPHAAVPSRVLAAPRLGQPVGATASDDNAVLLALGTAGDDTTARVRAGEATSLVLLSATALGLASCPVSEPLEVTATRDAVQLDVFGADAFPQMLLRVGWAPVNAEPLPTTPRRSLTEVVTRLDGSAFR